MSSSKWSDPGKAPSSAGRRRGGRHIPAERPAGKAAPEAAASGAVTLRRLSMPKDGRLVIPADLREALGLREGGTVVAELRDGALVIETMPRRLRRLRELVRASDRGTGSVVEEFLAEKRTEAARE